MNGIKLMIAKSKIINKIRMISFLFGSEKEFIIVFARNKVTRNHDGLAAGKFPYTENMLWKEYIWSLWKMKMQITVMVFHKKYGIIRVLKSLISVFFKGNLLWLSIKKPDIIKNKGMWKE